MSECCDKFLNGLLEPKKNCGYCGDIDEEVTQPIQISVQNEPKEFIKDIISKTHYVCSNCNFKVPKAAKAELLVLHFENSHPEDDVDIVELTPELIKRKFQQFLGTKNQS